MIEIQGQQFEEGNTILLIEDNKGKMFVGFLVNFNKFEKFIMRIFKFKYINFGLRATKGAEIYCFDSTKIASIKKLEL